MTKHDRLALLREVLDVAAAAERDSESIGFDDALEGPTRSRWIRLRRKIRECVEEAERAGRRPN